MPKVPQPPSETAVPVQKRHKSEGHRKRLREKFLKAGLVGFHDYEVIEMLLTLGTPRKDCKDLAKEVLKRFKSLQGVLSASSHELREIKGIGPNNVFGLKLIKAVADRYLEKKLIGEDPLRNSKALFDYLYHHIRDKKRESFMGLFLDAKNRVLAIETLFVGTLTRSAVYPREAAAVALSHNAAAVIFAHNHPSGDPDPSPADVAITHQLVFACRLLGITVHDHLVIGNNQYYSFADNGYIKNMNRDFKQKFKTW